MPNEGKIAIVLTPHGIARIQLRADTPGEERASLKLYNRVKSLLGGLHRQAAGSPAGSAAKGRR